MSHLHRSSIHAAAAAATLSSSSSTSSRSEVPKKVARPLPPLSSSQFHGSSAHASVVPPSLQKQGSYSKHISKHQSSSSYHTIDDPSAMTDTLLDEELDAQLLSSYSGFNNTGLPGGGFTSSLHTDDDDINLYLVAELLKEKKRKIEEESYRQPFSIPSTSTSPIQSQSRSLATSSIKYSTTYGSSVVHSSSSSSSSSNMPRHSAVSSSNSRSGMSLSPSNSMTKSALPQRYAPHQLHVAAVSPRNLSPSPSPRPSSLATSSRQQAVPGLASVSDSTISGSASPMITARKRKQREETGVKSSQPPSSATSQAAVEIVQNLNIRDDINMMANVCTKEIPRVNVNEDDEDDDDIQITFHDDTLISPSPVASVFVSPIVSKSTLSQQLRQLQPRVTFSQLTAHLPRVFSFLSTSSKAGILSVHSSFRDTLLHREWSSSSWSLPSVASKQVMQKLQNTYGVDETQHGQWIISANPPSSFLMKQLQELKLRGDPTQQEQQMMLMPSVASSFPLTDSQLVLLPYFTALRVLDMSYLGFRSVGTPVVPMPYQHQITGITLSRIASLPVLQTLILDHCTEWITDLALACLRNKDNSNTYRNGSAVAVGMVICQQQQYLPPSNALPSLTSLSLEGCSKLTSRGLEYLLGNNGLPSLTSLNLASCSPVVLTNESISAVRWNCPKMMSLNLAWCCGGGNNQLLQQQQQSSANMNSFLKPIFTLPLLASLNLHGFVNRSEIYDNSLNLTNAPIQHLILKESVMSAPSLIQLTSIRSLISLDLSDCRQVSDSLLQMFGSNLIQLKSILLWNAAQLTDAGVHNFLFGSAQLHRTLQSFCITSNRLLTHHTCSLLAKCSSLHILEMADMSAMAMKESMMIICSAQSLLLNTLQTLLISRMPSITSITGSPDSSSSSSSSSSPVSLGSYLGSLSALHELDVSWNESITDEVVRDLLHDRSKVQKLNLSRCPIRDASIRLLSQHAIRLVERHDVHLGIDIKYCPHVTSAGVAAFSAVAAKASLEENLHEYARSTPSQQPHPVTPPSQTRSSRIDRVSRSRTPSGFRIEDQIVVDEDEDHDDEEEEDDEDEDDDASMNSNSQPQFSFEEHVEEDEQGGAWAVHD